MNNIFEKIPLSPRELLLSSLLLLGFLTVNLEVLPMGEYQPIILMALAMVAFLQDGKLSFRLMLLAAMLLLMAAIGLAFGTTTDLASALKIFVLISYILFGWRLIPLCNLWVMRWVVILLFFVIICGLLASSPTRAILGIFFPRGTLYYYGFNSFFSSEPSYASLNLFGLYIMYLLSRSTDKIKDGEGFLFAIIAILLVATMSITGIIFAMLILMNQFIMHGGKSIKSKITIYVLILFTFSAVAAYVMFKENSRLGVFFNFALSAFDGDFLANWLLLEPSSVVRFISNAAGWYEGIGSYFGTGTFGFAGPSSQIYPDWLSSAFRSIDIIDKGSSAQTPFFNIVLYGGYIGLFFYFIIFLFIFKPLIALPREFRMLVIAFLLICSLWQAAITYPFYWLVISYLIHQGYMKRILD